MQFKKFHSSSDYGNNDGKEINNIVTLLAFLYSFKVSVRGPDEAHCEIILSLLYYLYILTIGD